MVTNLIILLCVVQIAASAYLQDLNMALMSAVALIGWLSTKRYEKLMSPINNEG